MKRISIFLLPLILLTSCSSNEDKIRLVQNYNIISENTVEPYIEIDEQNIISKIENKEAFYLYIYSTSCSYCKITSENITSISKNIPYTIYRYTPSLSSYEVLFEYNSNIFPKNLVTPRLLIIKNGKLQLEINTNRLIKENLLKNSLSTFTYHTNLYTLNNLNSFLSFASNNDSFLIYNYSSLKPLDYNLKEEINSLLEKSNKPILYLDSIDLEEELNQYINNNINKNSYDNFIITNYSNNYSNYLDIQNNIEEIKNIINSYCIDQK